ncbi:MAG: hypothetical protein A4E33_00794 [Methanoregula sp. PtaB.Bin085]|nr:MAG: hypothetical protein A4E33_00794 [Methanoregula sp. PtaB.Bin085]
MIGPQRCRHFFPDLEFREHFYKEKTGSGEPCMNTGSRPNEKNPLFWIFLSAPRVGAPVQHGRERPLSRKKGIEASAKTPPMGSMGPTGSSESGRSVRTRRKRRTSGSVESAATHINRCMGTSALIIDDDRFSFPNRYPEFFSTDPLFPVRKNGIGIQSISRNAHAGQTKMLYSTLLESQVRTR